MPYTNAETNKWITDSELCTSGRALGPTGDVPVAVLPKNNELLQPVSDSPDKDIMLADRYRPSTETLAAQKGPQREEICLQSLVSGVSLTGPKLFVSLTGYVEDVGVAASWHLLV